jgi:hypothetical protein
MREQRVPLVQELVAAGFGCEVGPLLKAYGLDSSHCRGRIEGLHELRKRSAGGSLTNPDNLVPACNPCNGFIEQEPGMARSLGLVILEGDPEWEALGARQDPT